MNDDRRKFAVISERSAVGVVAKETANGCCSPIDWSLLNVSL